MQKRNINPSMLFEMEWLSLTILVKQQSMITVLAYIALILQFWKSSLIGYVWHLNVNWFIAKYDEIEEVINASMLRINQESLVIEYLWISAMSSIDRFLMTQFLEKIILFSLIFKSNRKKWDIDIVIFCSTLCIITQVYRKSLCLFGSL